MNLRIGAQGRARNRAKTHCPHGHPYEGENLYVAPNGYRQCRTCRRRNWKRAYRAIMERTSC